MGKILLTGGTGFIGSHTAVELIAAGHDVVLVDNLWNSKRAVVDKIAKITGQKPKFYEADLCDLPALQKIFAENDFSAVMHFAGLKAVAESVEQPLKYYQNNIIGTLNLLDCVHKADVPRIIFSSSATVYGEQNAEKITEDLPVGRALANPYGRTKYFIEEILRDAAAADPNLRVSILRYFNPVGAHPSGLIGEDPNDRPNNLMPIIMKVATGEYPELQIYGDDYDTSDGTPVRDYIHVVDLARGHVAALGKLDTGAQVQVYNLGSGRGLSVKEIVQAFAEAAGRALPYKIAARRAGDLSCLVADPTKANHELGWHTELGIKEIMRDTLNFLQLQI